MLRKSCGQSHDTAKQLPQTAPVPLGGKYCHLRYRKHIFGHFLDATITW